MPLSKSASLRGLSNVKDQQKIYIFLKKKRLLVTVGGGINLECGFIFERGVFGDDLFARNCYSSVQKLTIPMQSREDIINKLRRLECNFKPMHRFKYI